MAFPVLPPLDELTSSLVRELIAAYVPDHPSHAEAGAAATRLGWLPVSWQMGGTLLLHPDGRTGVLSDGPSPYSITPEEGPVWCLIARIHAARKYPDLAVALPVKSESDIPCSECGGRGTTALADVTFDCPSCHGLGWGATAA
jgi:hypothetical protein